MLDRALKLACIDYVHVHTYTCSLVSILQTCNINTQPRAHTIIDISHIFAKNIYVFLPANNALIVYPYIEISALNCSFPLWIKVRLMIIHYGSTGL